MYRYLCSAVALLKAELSPTFVAFLKTPTMKLNTSNWLKSLVTCFYQSPSWTTFIIPSSGHKQKHGVEASRAKIQQIYENLELDLDLKLLFMITGACYESGLCTVSTHTFCSDTYPLYEQCHSTELWPLVAPLSSFCHEIIIIYMY